MSQRPEQPGQDPMSQQSDQQEQSGPIDWPGLREDLRQAPLLHSELLPSTTIDPIQLSKDTMTRHGPPEIVHPLGGPQTIDRALSLSNGADFPGFFDWPVPGQPSQSVDPQDTLLQASSDEADQVPEDPKERAFMEDKEHKEMNDARALMASRQRQWDIEQEEAAGYVRTGTGGKSRPPQPSNKRRRLEEPQHERRLQMAAQSDDEMGDTTEEEAVPQVNGLGIQVDPQLLEAQAQAGAQTHAGGEGLQEAAQPNGLTITIDPQLEEIRAQMSARFAQAGIEERQGRVRRPNRLAIPAVDPQPEEAQAQAQVGAQPQAGMEEIQEEPLAALIESQLEQTRTQAGSQLQQAHPPPHPPPPRTAQPNGLAISVDEQLKARIAATRAENKARQKTEEEKEAEQRAREQDQDQEPRAQAGSQLQQAHPPPHPPPPPTAYRQPPSWQDPARVPLPSGQWVWEVTESQLGSGRPKPAKCVACPQPVCELCGNGAERLSPPEGEEERKKTNGGERISGPDAYKLAQETYGRRWQEEMMPSPTQSAESISPVAGNGISNGVMQGQEGWQSWAPIPAGNGVGNVGMEGPPGEWMRAQAPTPPGNGYAMNSMAPAPSPAGNGISNGGTQGELGKTPAYTGNGMSNSGMQSMMGGPMSWAPNPSSGDGVNTVGMQGQLGGQMESQTGSQTASKTPSQPGQQPGPQEEYQVEFDVDWMDNLLDFGASN